MIDLINKYERLSAELCFLNHSLSAEELPDDCPAGITPATLSEEIHVPLEIVREDLMFILASPIFRTACISELKPMEIVDILGKQSHGWEHIPLAFSLDCLDLDPPLTGIPVYMTPIEQSVFRSVLNHREPAGEIVSVKDQWRSSADSDCTATDHHFN